VTTEAPPVAPGALTDAPTLGRAAWGGTLAFVGLVAVCEVIAVLQFLLVGVYGLWSWGKIGLLTALLSLRAEMVASVQGPPILRTATDSRTLQVRFVPLVLTIGFLWLAARAGGRAARVASGRSPLVVAGLAAGAGGVPVAVVAGASSVLVDLFFPALGLRLQVDAASAALWSGIVAAFGVGIGAYLEAARDRPAASALRGGLTSYGWALGLLAVGVFLLATLEPTVTKEYAEGVSRNGALGGVLFGYHLLAFPAQSALLLAPASGSCVQMVSDGSIFDLCPWRVVGSGPAGGAFLPRPLTLSPWFWLLSAVPFAAAILGGRRAVRNGTSAGGRAVGLGVVAGSIFGVLAVVVGWFAAPEVFSVSSTGPHVSVHVGWVRTAISALVWGVAGGGLGAWFGARRYEEPEFPRPTSA
jgi:hypothetical protein